MSNNDKNNDMLHRDDVPMDLAEQIVSDLKAIHPGAKVIFAGDAPSELPPEIAKQFEDMQREQTRLFAESRCVDCHKQMSNPMPSPDDEAAWDKWQPDKGWGRYETMDGTGMILWICPECSAAEEVRDA